MESTLSHANTQLLTREHLAALPVPPATRTHVPVPHHEVIQALTETLGFRHIGIVREQYAVDRTGMKMFGVLDPRYALGPSGWCSSEVTALPPPGFVKGQMEMWYFCKRI